jgi:hypothetical protein
VEQGLFHRGQVLAAARGDLDLEVAGGEAVEREFGLGLVALVGGDLTGLERLSVAGAEQRG